jgi:hypothetical protein
LHDTVRACLEKAVEATPDHAESWAQLTYLYLDEYRFGFTGVSDRGSLLDLALAAAQRAVELDEHSALAHLACSLIWFHRHAIARQLGCPVSDRKDGRSVREAKVALLTQLGKGCVAPGVRWMVR